MSTPATAPPDEAPPQRPDELDRRAVGSALFAVVAMSYLAFVAVGVLVFRGRPFVGGAAAVFALALSRVLQWTVMAKLGRSAAR